MFRDFYAHAHEKTKQLEKRLAGMEKQCTELATFFGTKITKWEELFAVFDDFLTDFQVRHLACTTTRALYAA